MSDTDTNTGTVTRTKTNARMYKVMLENDDFTPREFVIKVLKAVFRMTDEEASHKMMTAHQQAAA